MVLDDKSQVCGVGVAATECHSIKRTQGCEGFAALFMLWLVWRPHEAVGQAASISVESRDLTAWIDTACKRSLVTASALILAHPVLLSFHPVPAQIHDSRSGSHCPNRRSAPPG